MSIWDKMRAGAGRAAAEAQKQATATRLGMQIDDHKTEIRRKTAELGRLALELVQKGEVADPTLQGVAKEIAALEAQISELQAQVTAVKGSSPAPDVTPTQTPE